MASTQQQALLIPKGHLAPTALALVTADKAPFGSPRVRIIPHMLLSSCIYLAVAQVAQSVANIAPATARASPTSTTALENQSSLHCSLSTVPLIVPRYLARWQMCSNIIPGGARSCAVSRCLSTAPHGLTRGLIVVSMSHRCLIVSRCLALTLP